MRRKELLLVLVTVSLVSLVLALVAPSPIQGPRLVLAGQGDCEGDCPEERYCTWADPPIVRGEVAVNGVLTDGILVEVKNITENYWYQPYGPDSTNCDPPLGIP